MSEKYWDDYVVHSKPAYTLGECITLDSRWFEEEELTDIPALVEKLKERFRAALFVCDEEQLNFICDAMAMSAEKISFTEIPSGGFHSFHNNNYIFFFSWEDNDYLVLPDELAEVYTRVISEPDFAAKSKHSQELCAYANALLHLYGAYEIDWLVKVWNHHHREKIKAQDARQTLSDLALFHSDFYFIDDFVVHDCLYEDEFEELLAETDNINYYMPTKSVIAMYAASDIDYYERIPGAKEMNTFLASVITDEVKLDNLQFELTMSCERLESFESVRAYLEEAGFPLEDSEASGKFVKLFQNLMDSTHIWELHGFTPYQYENETGNRLKRFTLPTAKPGKKKQRK